eukprot:TRINITY_DN47474_c0_g1_i2.p1 TRINITY_DN47474_c0_g1~~TRINITY_DN47474_c0_g1_i2.p1  ORF type:complete len:508 (-),score=104.44 TRINITY_DN47474_c0_g1_i2:233-1756(-)
MQALQMQRNFGDIDGAPSPATTRAGSLSPVVTGRSVSPADCGLAGARSDGVALGDVLDWVGSTDVLEDSEYASFSPLPQGELLDWAEIPRELSATSEDAVGTPMQPRLSKIQRRSPLDAAVPTGSSEPAAPPPHASNVERTSFPAPGRSPSPAARAAERIRTQRALSSHPGTACARSACRTEAEDWDDVRLSPEDEEELEWSLRQERTGTVGRLVAYAEGDNPKDDLLLRGGAGRHVVVAAVRDGGPACCVGVKAGDRLVSIDGNKDFMSSSADIVCENLTPPTVLVFLGFVGKLQAEVRLSECDTKAGLNLPRANLRGMLGDRCVEFCESSVFDGLSSSLIMASSTDSSSHDANLKPSETIRLLFELHQMEANRIVRKAMQQRSFLLSAVQLRGAPVADDGAVYDEPQGLPTTPQTCSSVTTRERIGNVGFGMTDGSPVARTPLGQSPSAQQNGAEDRAVHVVKDLAATLDKASPAVQQAAHTKSLLSTPSSAGGRLSPRALQEGS